VRVPDKSSGVLCSGASVTDKYEFIDAEYAAAAADTATTAPTIRQMCEWLGVSRSGFYEWRNNPGSATAKRREGLKLLITKAFDDSDGTYGYRRVHAQLRRWDVECGDELVRDLMRELGLLPCQVRRRRSLTVQAAAGPIPDLVGRDFTAEKPGEKMVGDITYIFTWEGWLYLATVIDCATRMVVGWAMDDNYKTPLITSAIKMAARNIELPGEAVFHSDRQASNRQLRVSRVRRRTGETRYQAVGRPDGNLPLDNALAESFNGALKVERVHRTVSRHAGKHGKTSRATSSCATMGSVFTPHSATGLRKKSWTSIGK
jgi:putative transposase